MSTVLNLLNEVNLKINVEKSVFCCIELVILGYHISREGIRIAKEKLFVMDSWIEPSTGKQVEIHSGFFGYFREMIPNYAKLVEPLERIRHAKVVLWNDQFRRIYKTLRNILPSDLVLSLPDFSAPFLIGTDASDRGLGAVLSQQINGEVKFISFASRALTSGERSYGAPKRELAAVIFALEHFQYYVFGVHFTLYTDHKALCFMFTQKHTNQMINNWFETLLKYDFSVIYLPGILNILPDRPSISSS